jgi:putative ABC transport system ATP-binding protein
MIEVKKLNKIYQIGEIKNHVLKDIDLEIESGEFVSIVGKSGAGKSTLLYQLSLLDTPTSGDIIYEGKNTSEFNKNKRVAFRLNELGYIFQDYALLPELTATENVILPLLMLGQEKDRAIKTAQKTLAKLGLKDRVDNLPSQLSGGEQQRVSIARAIAQEPKILFADEPTANLDIATSEEVLKILTELNKNGQTIVMITHEIEYADLAKRKITLSDGKIISDKKLR